MELANDQTRLPVKDFLSQFALNAVVKV